MEGMVTPGFWQGRRVLLTGHTGFKGSWLALWLARLGARVTGFALPPATQPSMFELLGLAGDVSHVEGDVRDDAAVARTVADAKPEIVIHLAAQSLVREGYRSPAATYATNVMGTVNVLEAVRQHEGVRVLLNVTSDKCYENQDWIWGYREQDPMGGYDPYSSSKGCAELVTAAYRRSYFGSAADGCAVATARAGNVLGGGDWAADRLVPDLVRAFMDGRPAAIRNPAARRPWQHVLDPLAGYMRLIERLWSEPGAYTGAWNFGPADADVIPVGEVADALARSWGGGASWVQAQGEHPHEAATLKLDCSKAHMQLAWHPQLTLQTALDQVVAWYQGVHREPARAREITEGQIDSFQECSGP